MIRVEKVSYAGWDNCLKITAGATAAIVTLDVGPRIISYSFAGKENVFCEVEEQKGKKGGDEWVIYGGHRLWHSPECKPRTYQPDNAPVQYEIKADRLILRQKIEPWTMIRKEVEISDVEGQESLEIKHRLINEGAWEAELAVWALTVMKAGGVEIIPQVSKETGLLPNRMVALWPYTKMNDSRVTWGDRYIVLKQDKTAQTPFKIGLSNEDGWAAYINGGTMFVKSYKHIINAAYPDYASSYETYTNNYMVEMESLSPLIRLLPGAAVEHTEKWRLFGNVDLPQTEDEIERQILPLITRL